MSEAELIEELRAQVMSLKSPRGPSRHVSTESSSSTTSSLPTYARDGGTRIPRASRAPSRQQRTSTPTQNHYGGGSGGGGCGPEPETAVVVNVGGTSYTTSVATLKAVESSYFSLMLNGLWEPISTPEGHMFVDRNGALFEYVLEYLRGQCHKEMDDFQLPTDLNTLKALRREAEFYQLPGLVSRLTKAIEMADVKERCETAATDFSSSSKEEESGMLDFDIVYSAVSYTHPQFPEEVIQDLTVRINYLVAQKHADGFRVRDVNSGLILDHTKQQPYSMYIQVVVVRERKPGQPPLYSGRHPQSTSLFISTHYNPQSTPVPQHTVPSFIFPKTSFHCDVGTPPMPGIPNAIVAGYEPDAHYSKAHAHAPAVDSRLNNQTQTVLQPIQVGQEQSYAVAAVQMANRAEGFGRPTSVVPNSGGRSSRVVTPVADSSSRVVTPVADRSARVVTPMAGPMQQAGDHSLVTANQPMTNGDPFVIPIEVIPRTSSGTSGAEMNFFNDGTIPVMDTLATLSPEYTTEEQNNEHAQWTIPNGGTSPLLSPGSQNDDGLYAVASLALSAKGAEEVDGRHTIFSPRDLHYAQGAEYDEEQQPQCLGSARGPRPDSGSGFTGIYSARRPKSQNSVVRGVAAPSSKLGKPVSRIPRLNLATASPMTNKGLKAKQGRAIAEPQDRFAASGGLPRSAGFLS